MKCKTCLMSNKNRESTKSCTDRRNSLCSGLIIKRVLSNSLSSYKTKWKLKTSINSKTSISNSSGPKILIIKTDLALNKKLNWNNQNIKGCKKNLLLLSLSQITITSTLTSKDLLITTNNPILKIQISSTLIIIKILIKIIVIILINFQCIKTRTIMKIRKINLNHLLLATLQTRNGKYDHSLIISFPHIILSCHLFIKFYHFFIKFYHFFATLLLSSLLICQ